MVGRGDEGAGDVERHFMWLGHDGTRDGLFGGFGGWGKRWLSDERGLLFALHISVYMCHHSESDSLFVITQPCS